MNRIIAIPIICFLLIFKYVDSNAKTIYIKSVNDYKKSLSILKSGDSVIWKNGIYPDVRWNIKKNGLIVLAEISGKVIFSGSSSITIESDSLVFSGFQFKDGSTKEDVVEISGNYNTIRNINIDKFDSHYYFKITANARHNRIEFCNFENKPSAAPGKEGSSIFQVAVDSVRPGYNLIRYCSFKNHQAPPNSGGDYGMEALRIGYSFQSEFISRTIVEYCYFTRCNGDGEIISNKARQNVFRYNTFENNGDSHLTLRHGSENVVYGNFFINGAGLRIKEGQNQMVYNNYFNAGKYFAIRLENYKVDPLENINIIHNTFVRTGALKMGGKGDFKPKNVMLYSNLFFEPTENIIDDFTGNETIQNNGYQSDKTYNFSGFSQITEKIETNIYGFFQPQKSVLANKKKLKFKWPDIPELDDDPFITLDITGNIRPQKNKSAGCFEPGKKTNDIILYVTNQNTGPDYLFPQPTAAKTVLPKGMEVKKAGNLKEFQEYIYKEIDTVKLKLYIKNPANFNPNKSYPAIIFFFGGGWNSGSVNQFHPHAEYFASRGIISILADYRVKSRHGTSPFDAVADAKSAIRFLRSNANSLYIDPSKIIASGGSAGGHLAAATATVNGLNDNHDNLNISAIPNALVLFNPVFDTSSKGYGFERVGERYTEISPMHNLKKGTPPTIVFLGTKDDLIPVETAKLYKQKMEEVGSRCDLFLYEGQKHGFFNFREGNNEANKNYIETVYQADLFLKSLKYLSGKPTIKE